MRVCVLSPDGWGIDLVVNGRGNPQPDWVARRQVNVIARRGCAIQKVTGTKCGSQPAEEWGQ